MCLKRDLATLSQSANRLRKRATKDKILWEKIENIRNGDRFNIRDWLHVEDLCQGIDLVLKKGRVGETYNIGGNCEKTNMEVVEAVCGPMDELSPNKDVASYSPLITYVKDRPGHDRRYAIDADLTPSSTCAIILLDKV